MSRNSGKRRIIMDGIMVLSKEDGEFINEKDLSSADMFRIFGIIAENILGIKMKGYHFDPEKCRTTVHLE